VFWGRYDLAGHARALRFLGTLHTGLRRWTKDGPFERMLRAARTKADAAGGMEWLVSAESTIIQAHQHAFTVTGGRTNDCAQFGTA
jgi:hypothetical protein